MRASCKLHWIAAAPKRLAMTCEPFNRIRNDTLPVSDAESPIPSAPARNDGAGIARIANRFTLLCWLP